MPSSPHEGFKKFPLNLHPEVKETFADQLGYTMFDGSTLRIDFAVARMDEPKPPNPPTGERHVVCRLVLSPGCFIDLLNTANRLAAQLAQAGILKMEGDQAKPAKAN